MLAGRMRFRVGGRRVIAGPATSVRVPPGTVHHFANAGSQPARVAVQTRPALSMQELLETAAALATGTARGRPPGAQPDRPGAVHARLRARRCGRRICPVVLVRAVTRPLAWLARRRGLDARYRRLRYRAMPAARRRLTPDDGGRGRAPGQALPGGAAQRRRRHQLRRARQASSSACSGRTARERRPRCPSSPRRWPRPRARSASPAGTWPPSSRRSAGSSASCSSSPRSTST